MENKPNSIEELFYKLKEYGETRFDLFRLKSINKISAFLSKLITKVILAILLFLGLICITIGFALLLGEILGKSYYGFFIIGGLYLVIGGIIFFSKNKSLKTTISNKLIKDLLD